MVDLGDKRADGTWCQIHLGTIIGCARAVDIKPGQDLGDGLVNPKDDLNMAGGVLRHDRDGILCANGGSLGQDRVFDAGFDLLDLLNGLFLGQPIQKQIDIRGRSKFLMLVFTQAAFRVAVLLRNG